MTSCHPSTQRAAYPDAELVPGITLAACELTTESVNARDETYHPPSGWAHIRLWWQLDEAVDVDYETTAQMVGPEGVWGERLYRENEVLDYWPTSAWQPGEFVREELDINLNPLTPPGVYPVVVGLKRPGDRGCFAHRHMRGCRDPLAPLAPLHVELLLQVGQTLPLAHDQFSQEPHQKQQDADNRQHSCGDKHWPLLRIRGDVQHGEIDKHQQAGGHSRSAPTRQKTASAPR